jgi:predicted ribosome quality control (RQC) complex YloA/Tae2 family protein
MTNFRSFFTSSGTKILAGKSAENNEELISQVEPTEIILHTAEAGSPFVNIKGKATKKDIKEAAIFCAKYSHDWRDNKKDVQVHIFRGADIHKDKKMKTGSFGVKKFETLKVKKEDILKLEKELIKNETS